MAWWHFVGSSDKPDTKYTVTIDITMKYCDWCHVSSVSSINCLNVNTVVTLLLFKNYLMIYLIKYYFISLTGSRSTIRYIKQPCNDDQLILYTEVWRSTKRLRYVASLIQSQVSIKDAICLYGCRHLRWPLDKLARDSTSTSKSKMS